MPLSYTELCELVEKGVITNVEPRQINAASIDLTLGDVVFIEKRTSVFTVDLSAVPRQYPEFLVKQIPTGYLMEPGEFLLASTEQMFNLPDDICAHYFLNSSLARAGLDAALAMWADPGWCGSNLTLEFKNNTRFNSLTIMPGMRAGQTVFHRVKPVPAERSYRAIGSYNDLKGPGVR
jgi:dCTP deaminase